MTQSDKAQAAAEKVYPRIDPTTVVGWGVDADPDNDPTWPIRDRSGDCGPDTTWDRPTVQVSGVEILQSVEYLVRPAVVGQSTPPSGLSGSLRRIAFRFSESQWGHWLLLMFADRINSIEGLFDDIRQGTIPNPLVESGFVPRRNARPAAWVTVAVAGTLLAGLILIARRRGEH